MTGEGVFALYADVSPDEDVPGRDRLVAEDAADLPASLLGKCLVPAFEHVDRLGAVVGHARGVIVAPNVGARGVVARNVG